MFSDRSPSHLVERDHDVRETDLPREQHVLTRLRHHAVERADDEDFDARPSAAAP